MDFVRGDDEADLASLPLGPRLRSPVLLDLLIEVIEEYPITTIVLGSSGQSAGLITPEYLRELGEQISTQTGTQFIVLHAGEVVCTFPE